MSSVTIHNVSDRPSINVEPTAYKVAGYWLRPGKMVEVPEEAVNTKLRALHGKCLWFGDLPPILVAESKSSVRAKKAKPVPMNKTQALDYLNSCDLQTLETYKQSITPPLNLKDGTPKSIISLRVAMACFSGSIALDPEVFFWLGKWEKTESGDYVEV